MKRAKRQRLADTRRPSLLPNLKLNIIESPLLFRMNSQSKENSKHKLKSHKLISRTHHLPKGKLSLSKRGGLTDWSSVDKSRREYRERSREILMKSRSNNEIQKAGWSYSGWQRNFSQNESNFGNAEGNRSLGKENVRSQKPKDPQVIQHKFTGKWGEGRERTNQDKGKRTASQKSRQNGGPKNKRRQSGSAFRSFQRRRKQGRFMSLGGGGMVMRREKKSKKKKKSKSRFFGVSYLAGRSPSRKGHQRGQTNSKIDERRMKTTESEIHDQQGINKFSKISKIGFGSYSKRTESRRPHFKMKVKDFRDLDMFLQCKKMSGIRENVLDRLRRTKCKTMVDAARGKEILDKTNRVQMVQANVERIKTFFRSQSPVGRKLLSLNPSLALEIRNRKTPVASDAFFNVLDKHSKHYIMVRKGEILDEMPEFVSFLRVYASESIPILVGICRLIATTKLLFRNSPLGRAKVESFRIRVGDIIKLARTVKPEKGYLQAIKNFRKDRDYQVLLDLCKGNDFAEFHCTKLLSICQPLKSTNSDTNAERGKIKHLAEFKIRAADLIKRAMRRYRDTRLFRMSLKHKKGVQVIKSFLQKLSTRFYVKRRKASAREKLLLTFLKINEPGHKFGGRRVGSDLEESFFGEQNSFDMGAELMSNLISEKSDEGREGRMREPAIGESSRLKEETKIQNESNAQMEEEGSRIATGNLASQASQNSADRPSPEENPESINSFEKHSGSMFNNQPLGNSSLQPRQLTSKLPIEIHFLDDPLNPYEELFTDLKTAQTTEIEMHLLQKSREHTSLSKVMQSAKQGSLSTRLQLGRMFRILHSSKKVVFITRKRVSDEVIQYFYSLIDGVLPAEQSITSNLYFYNIDSERDGDLFSGVRSLSQRLLLDVQSVSKLRTYISNLGPSREVRIVNSHLSECQIQLSLALQLPLGSLCAVSDSLFKELYKVKSKFDMPLLQIFSLMHARRVKMPEAPDKGKARNESTLSGVCTRRANQLRVRRSILHEGQKTRKNALKIQIRNQELQFMNRNLETENNHNPQKKSLMQKKLKPDLLGAMFKNPSAVRRFKTEFLKSRERNRRGHLGVRKKNHMREDMERMIISNFRDKMEKKRYQKRRHFQGENMYLSEVKFSSKKKLFQYLKKLLGLKGKWRQIRLRLSGFFREESDFVIDGKNGQEILDFLREREDHPANQDPSPLTNSLSNFDTFTRLIPSCTCLVRVYSPVELNYKSFNRVSLEVIFEVNSAFLVSRIVVAEKKKVHILDEYGYMKLNCVNRKEEKKLKNKILELLESLKRRVGPGFYIARMNYWRSDDGRPLQLNLEYFVPGYSPLWDIEPFLNKNTDFFIYCPRMIPDMENVNFSSFFRILQRENYVFNLMVTFSIPKKDDFTRFSRKSSIHLNLNICGGSIHFVFFESKVEEQEGILIFPHSDQIDGQSLGIFSTNRCESQALSMFNKFVNFILKSKNKKIKYSQR